MKANSVLTIGAVLTSLAGHAAHAQAIDPCLVGTWKATSVTWLTGAPNASGGEGFTVTFTPDGTQTADYSKMTPREWDKGAPRHNGLTYRGTAKGRITTSNNAAKIEAVEAEQVTLQVWHSGGPTQDEAVFLPFPGLGPGGLGSTASDNGYVCAGDTVEYKSSLAADKHPTHIVRLARVTDAGSAEASAPPPSIDAKGKTWLTLTEIKDREQDIQGLWREARGHETDDLLAAGDVHYFKASPSGALTDYVFGKYDEPWSLKMQAEADHAWRGEVQVCPIPYGTCLNLCRWVAGSMRIDPNHVTTSVAWRGKKTKADCSGFDDTPDSGTFELKRVVGVAFVPIAPGKYINVVGAPTVGNQAAQFKAMVRIVANYPGVPKGNIRGTADRGKLTLVDKEAGTYEFVAEESGVHELLFELRDPRGMVFHTDRMRVEVPGLPGLGR